jgi:hypothetical protein
VGGPGPEPWNHNRHHHRVILAAVPPGSERALDVGCGTGEPTRRHLYWRYSLVWAKPA